MTEEQRSTFMLKEVDLTEDIIKRMASNSFLIKGWAISVVTVVLVLKRTDAQALLAIVPIIAFWYVDAYYLRQERLYRELYKWVITNRLQTDDFLLDLNTLRFRKSIDSMVRTMFSKTLVPLYGSLLLAVILVWWEPLRRLLSSAAGP